MSLLTRMALTATGSSEASRPNFCSEAREDDGEPFAEKYPRLPAELEACFGAGERLMGVVREKLKGGLGNGR